MTWEGNILSNEGAWHCVGDIRAHIVRRAMDGWLRGLGLTAETLRPWKRSWIIAIYNTDPFRFETRPLVELVAFNVMPDQARREAERLAEWAAAYYEASSPAIAAASSKEQA